MYTFPSAYFLNLPQCNNLIIFIVHKGKFVNLQQDTDMEDDGILEEPLMPLDEEVLVLPNNTKTVKKGLHFNVNY